MQTKWEDLIGLGVIFGFIALAWYGFTSGQFGETKALAMALTGIPLGLLAPVMCAPRDT